jgi:hypothetical protein
VLQRRFAPHFDDDESSWRARRARDTKTDTTPWNSKLVYKNKYPLNLSIFSCWMALFLLSGSQSKWTPLPPAIKQIELRFGFGLRVFNDSCHLGYQGLVLVQSSFLLLNRISVDVSFLRI